MTLITSARKLHDALDPHAVLIGGICGAIHGVERFTRDVDLATDLPPDAVLAALAKASIAASLRSSPAGEPLPWVVTGTLDGVPFQVMPAAQVGVDLARAERRAELKVASIADFIVSKCLAAGQQDLHDVAVLALLDDAILPFARARAREQRCLDKLEAWLCDARLRARYAR